VVAKAKTGIALALMAAQLCVLGDPAIAAAPPAGQAGAVVPGSAEWDMRSEATGATYRISVAEPVSGVPAAGVPVLYVLDGNGYFGAATDMARIQELGMETRGALVVAIGYPLGDDPAATRERRRLQRVMDLTPDAPKGAEALVARQMGGAPVGGAERFLQFLKRELEPELARRYRIDASDTALFGHSLAGRFALDVAFTHPESFRAIVAASPSIYWGGGDLLAREKDFARRVAAGGKGPRLLITVGGLEETVLDLPLPGEADRAGYAQYVREARTVENAREMAGRLAKLPSGSGFVADFALFGGETHVSTVAAALARGIRFAFAAFAFPKADAGVGGRR